MALNPRSGSSEQPINQRVRDRGIAHAVYLERLKTGEAAKVIADLDANVIPDLLDKLEARMRRVDARGFDLGKQTTERLRNMIEALQETVQAWQSGLSERLIAALKDVAVHEAEWQAGAVNAALPPPVRAVFETVIPAVATIQSAILSNPLDGVLLEDILARLGAKSTEAITAEIRKGIVAGDTTPQIVARVRGVTEIMRSTAETVVRTAVGHASNVARNVTYQANADLIKGVQLVETLDTRTCLRCQALDGQVFPIDKGPRAPHHLNCRGTTVPVLKSWRELGIAASDLDPGTRASMNGQVSGKVTFGDWIKTQPADVQDEALGKGRAALLRFGKLEVRDFVDRRGDPYTLDELKKRDPAAFSG